MGKAGQQPYYWLTGRLQLLEEGDDIDINVLEQGYASLTPIQYDMTAYNLLQDVKEIDL
jgi:5'-nucleotidase